MPDSGFGGVVKLSVMQANNNPIVNSNGINITNFPVGEVNNTAHAVLINDNINKIPRDLAEVGPDQKQYRSSVSLSGRVENYKINKGKIIGVEPSYDFVTNSITYNISAQGTLDAWQTAKPGDLISCDEAAADLPGPPPTPNPNRWFANTTIISNENLNNGTGRIVFSPKNKLVKSVSGSYTNFTITSASNKQYFPTSKPDFATSIANSFDFSFLDNSLDNVIGSAGANLYQLQTNPIITRISTKKA